MELRIEVHVITVNGTLTMWKANEDEPATPRISWWYNRPRSADTETTAYALLTKLIMVKNDNTRISEGLPIVRWLSTQRNSYGGFGSTQVCRRFIRKITWFINNTRKTIVMAFNTITSVVKSDSPSDSCQVRL